MWGCMYKCICTCMYLFLYILSIYIFSFMWYQIDIYLTYLHLESITRYTAMGIYRGIVTVVLDLRGDKLPTTDASNGSHVHTLHGHAGSRTCFGRRMRPRGSRVWRRADEITKVTHAAALLARVAVDQVWRAVPVHAIRHVVTVFTACKISFEFWIQIYAPTNNIVHNLELQYLSLSYVCMFMHGDILSICIFNICIEIVSTYP
jgi:hypothetical protein